MQDTLGVEPFLNHSLNLDLFADYIRLDLPDNPVEIGDTVLTVQEDMRQL